MKKDGPVTKILLVDDDVDLSSMLRQYLENEGFEVTVQFNGQHAVAAATGNLFDIVILDIMLPDVSGIELLRQIRKASTIPTIMLTARGDGVDRVVGLELGADDYIAKPYYPPELVARIKAVLRRRTDGQTASRDQGRLTFGELTANVPARKVTWRTTPLTLTISEFNMLLALMESGEKVATKDQLSLNVLGRPRATYDRSVDVHVSNLRHKLSTMSKGAIEIETVRGVGYRLKDHV